MKSNKVLIIKHGALGDIFMSFDSIKSIHNTYLDITICSTQSGLNTLDLLGFKFDKILDNRHGIIESLKVLKKIVDGKFDIIFDLQNSKRTSSYLLFLRLFTSSVSNGTSFFACKRYIKDNINQHVTVGLKNQINLMGIKVSKDIRFNKIIKSNQVVIVPGSSIKGKRKRWPISKYKVVIDFLVKKKVKCYVIGGKDELDLLKEIPTNKLVINLINQSPWEVVKKVSSISKVVISNDTSAMHYISNLNIPIIAIMKDDNYAIRNAPKSDNSIVLKNNNINNILAQTVINEVAKFI